MTSYTLLDGVHNLKLEVEDLAGNLSEDFLLTVTIDTVAPPREHQPASTRRPRDTGVEDQPGHVRRPDHQRHGHRVLSAGPRPTRSCGSTPIRRATASIDNPAEYSLTVAMPEDGNLAEPDGQWRDRVRSAT